MKKVLFITISLVFCSLFILAIFVKNDFIKQKNNVKPTPTKTRAMSTQEGMLEDPSMGGTPTFSVSPQTESFEDVTTVPNQYKYTSYKLGVSFLYLKEQNGMKFKVDEDTDNEKIYLYQDVTYIQDPRKSAQYVEVTRKDKNETLQKALENSVLADYSPTDCKVSLDVKVDKHINYEYANVVVAKSYNDLGELMPLLNKCPSPYTASNGLSYFVSPVNGSRFAFLFIGQYGIMSGIGNKGWQDTLEFND